MVQACHMPWQPLPNYPSGHLGGWEMLWSAEEMLDGQHQRVDIPARARTAHKGLPQKRLEADLCWIIPHVPLMTQPVKGLTWTELTLRVVRILCWQFCSCSCLPPLNNVSQSDATIFDTDSCQFCESTPAQPVLCTLLKLFWRDSHMGSVSFWVICKASVKHLLGQPWFLLA